MSRSHEGFIARWSRLKREPEPAAAPAEQPAGEAPPPALPEGRTLDDLLAELPKLEHLVPGQSLAAFMQPWVPTGLRNAALQRMWLLDPAIRDYVSPALDYAYDYNTPGAAPGFGPIETGRDAIREVAEMFDRALARDAAGEPVGKSGDDDNVSQAPADPAPEHAALQQVPPAVRVSGSPGAGESGDDADKPRQTGVESGSGRAATHNNASDTNDLRPVARRHGSALPG
ncbi:DUF3306 domain-containing protein [Phreatobacter sp.]|uniref:DUF3306 domain-containing protein n=1 Tax=Phreatobacter sp. TaxID=1966341 RepID=UPI0025F38B25|nr:DUF3306 domain-containing protein [Phreatobacter sp.]